MVVALYELIDSSQPKLRAQFSQGWSGSCFHTIMRVLFVGVGLWTN